MPTHASAMICCFLLDLDSVIDENFRDWVSSQVFSLKTYVRCFGVGWKVNLHYDLSKGIRLAESLCSGPVCSNPLYPAARAFLPSKPQLQDHRSKTRHWV